MTEFSLERTGSVPMFSSEVIQQRGVFAKFRDWVVGMAHDDREPVPFYGYGGPVETPFANTIPTPENAARRSPLSE